MTGVTTEVVAFVNADVLWRKRLISDRGFVAYIANKTEEIILVRLGPQ